MASSRSSQSVVEKLLTGKKRKHSELGYPEQDFIDVEDEDVQWAKLKLITKTTTTSVDSTVSIKGTQFKIGRGLENHLQIVDPRLSMQHAHITRSFDESGTMVINLHDLSTNGTFLNDLQIGKGNHCPLANGDEIYLIMKRPDTEIKTGEEIGFIFVLLQDMSKAKNKRQRTEETSQKSKIGNSESSSGVMTQSALLQKLADEHECGICCEIFHQPVQLAPCLHTFCGGCLSDWVARGQKDCPSCRKDVSSISKSFQARNTVEMIINGNPTKFKRQAGSLKELEAKNMFKDDVHIVQQQYPQLQQAQISSENSSLQSLEMIIQKPKVRTRKQPAKKKPRFI